MIVLRGVGLAILVTGLVGVAVAQPSQLGILKVTVAVELSCPSCAAGLERRLGRLDNVASVEIKSEQGQVVVMPVPNTSFDLAAVRDVIRNAGYEPGRTAVTAVGRVAAGPDSPVLELAAQSVIALAPGRRTDAVVAEVMGHTVKVTGHVAADPGPGDTVLHIDTFEVP